MRIPVLLAVLFCFEASSQELFVNTEPASNIPARSVSIKFSAFFIPNNPLYDRPAKRYIPELMVGINKNLMLRAGFSHSNMYNTNNNFESFFISGKYRFLSIDEIHKHFRMAAYIRGSKSRAPFHYNEVSLMGDKSGIDFGIITTQLWNKFALSGTISNSQLLEKSRFDDVVYIPKRIYRVMNYSLSAGYLLLPKEYSNYEQVNLNLYLEALAQQALNQHKFYLDLAPAIQLIFFSNLKLNMSYRFQVNGNISRMSENTWLISLERNFLNVTKANPKTTSVSIIN